MPFDIEGNIVDDKVVKITVFSPVHDGMGYFAIKPQPGTQYKAIWKDKKNVLHQSVLPGAKAQGV